MPPNLELFLLAFLHGSLIAALLLVAVTATSAALLLAFSLGLLSVAALDLLQLSPFVSRCFQECKANLELGFVLVVCVITDQFVGVALALKPSIELVVCEFKANARRVKGYVDALKLN